MNSRNLSLFFGLFVALIFALGSIWGAFGPRHFLMAGFCVLAVWGREHFARDLREDIDSDGDLE